VIQNSTSWATCIRDTGNLLYSRLFVTATAQRQTDPLWQSPGATEPILLLLAYGQNSDRPSPFSNAFKIWWW